MISRKGVHNFIYMKRWGFANADFISFSLKLRPNYFIFIVY